MLSGRGLCDELITRPEESYRLCCVVVCDPETSRMGASYIYDISRLRVKQIARKSILRIFRRSTFVSANGSRVYVFRTNRKQGDIRSSAFKKILIFAGIL